MSKESDSVLTAKTIHALRSILTTYSFDSKKTKEVFIQEASILLERLDCLNRVRNDEIRIGRTSISSILANSKKSSNVKIKQAPETDVGVVGDPELLGLLIDELIVNAQSYGTSEVEINLALEKGCLKVEVSSLGKGFEEIVAEKIPEAFNRGSNSKEGGHGLGLALVYAIADLHKVNIQTKLIGDEFSVIVPLDIA